MIRNIPLRFLAPGIIFLTGITFLFTFLLMEWKEKQDLLVNNMKHHAHVVGMALSGQVEAAIRKREPGDIHAAMQSIQGDVDLIRAAVIGPDNRIISATQIAAIGRQLHKSDFGDLIDLSRESRNPDRANLHTDAGDRLQAVFPLSARESEQSLLPDADGYLIMEYDLMRQAVNHDRTLLIEAGYSATAIATLSFLLWYFFQNRLLKRVQRLRQTAQRIGEGDFSQRPADDSNDELGDLANEFRTMAERLERNTRELSYQALHDNLTGLMNRWGFEQQVQNLIRRLPHDQREHAMIYMDLDQFRVINETWGHSAGDELLRQLARLLREKIFLRDFVARLGGDEFAILLEDCPASIAPEKAELLRRSVEDFRFQWQGHALRTTCSLGVIPIYQGLDDMENLFSLADAACYAAKHGGRNRIHVWQEGDEELERVHGEMRWINRIHTALEENRFLLYAQPIVPVTDNHDTDRVSYEILVRMRDEDGKIVPPGEFLTAAERYHLITSIDRWVVQHTISELAARPEHLKHLDMCSINLSGLSLNDSMSDFVSNTLDRTYPLLPQHICFEITETAAITHLGQAADFIRRMKELGCRFALDDFGSGVSSFGYLKNLPVDYIKIDGIFVRDMLDDPVDRAVVAAVNEVAQKMGKQTIAEFVESSAIRKALAEIGVDFAQGFGIKRPQPLEDLIGPARKPQR